MFLKPRIVMLIGGSHNGKLIAVGQETTAVRISLDKKRRPAAPWPPVRGEKVTVISEDYSLRAMMPASGVMTLCMVLDGLSDEEASAGLRRAEKEQAAGVEQLNS